MKFYKETQEIECEDASNVFAKIYQKYKKKFLLESRDISHVYGRLSLIGIDPALEIIGKNNEFSIKILNERGKNYIQELKKADFSICDQIDFCKDGINGKIKRGKCAFEESRRTKQKNIAQIIRIVLETFKINHRESIGLYGAFSYDFIRLFEDIPNRLDDTEINDFRLCLYDTFVFFDHLKDMAEVVAYREKENLAKSATFEICSLLAKENPVESSFEITNDAFEQTEDEYKDMVENAKKLAEKGELFEVVYSNTLHADFKGDPFALYKKYREINPSPYLFYFDFEDEYLVGASPEMMVRCENNRVQLRPISGTAKRGVDPIEDHENMLELLQSEKERAELDMLIDLGRNDLAKICEPGIEISDYRHVERYSKVMHTVAHLTGNLRKEFTAFDSLIACLNAGTLTGAPKVAAMLAIEKNEASRRGYYGGTVGYLTFSGNMDTAIVIRTAHIRDGKLLLRVGATLLYDSDPASEYQETLSKANAFLSTYSNKNHESI